MTEPTAEALAWEKREQAEETKGTITGAREICRKCGRPVGAPWGRQGTPGRVESCGCGTRQLPGTTYDHHGLSGLADRTQTGTTTYG